jgi:hypothetical protein
MPLAEGWGGSESAARRLIAGAVRRASVRRTGGGRRQRLNEGAGLARVGGHRSL